MFRTSYVMDDNIEKRTRGSNAEESGEVDGEALLNASSRSSLLLPTSSTEDASEGTEKHQVLQSKKQKKKTADIDLVSSVIMKLLGELREQLRESRRREEREDNITSFLCSLEYDIRQIPPHRLSALKWEITQVVRRYVHMQPSPPDHPTYHYNTTQPQVHRLTNTHMPPQPPTEPSQTCTIQEPPSTRSPASGSGTGYLM